MSRLILLAIFLLLTPQVCAADEARARGLINALGCKGCHRFEGSGGSIGPSLDQVGRHRDRQAILRLLRTPPPVETGRPMPSYAFLPQDDLEALADFFAGQQ
ncbi:hypothetical protein EDC39_11061 [Geothermobacter ehrlichii]|uniref:Cytochrome c domain-containing protein n=1 Tax=Geothermobacter ehrlichii TaxID=213224 RepID=A0A5D3WGF6_9BACT|nr:cytochrome c [Geothermobacter ehrlichii]TYO97521.1 hypothetical protein EDC39_11061 [Geothermobacter ehrlichii]